MEKEDEGIRTAVSFEHEHQIFPKDQILDEYGLELGQLVTFSLNEYQLAEICGRLGEVGTAEVESEAQALLSIFETMFTSNASFFLCMDSQRNMEKSKSL